MACCGAATCRTAVSPTAHNSSGSGDVTETRTPAIDSRKPPEMATIRPTLASSRLSTSMHRAHSGSAGDSEISRAIAGSRLYRAKNARDSKHVTVEIGKSDVRVAQAQRILTVLNAVARDVLRDLVSLRQRVERPAPISAARG